MTTTLPTTDREKLATLADHGYTVAKLDSGCGPAEGAWTLTDPDGDHLQIGGQGGVSTTRGAAIDEGMRRIAAETTTTTDPMADQTTWTTYGVSAAERAAIVAAAAMIGRTFRYRGGGEFSVLGVNDCRPAHNGASVYGTYRYVRSDGRADDTYNGSTWVANLGAEVVR